MKKKSKYQVGGPRKNKVFVQSDVAGAIDNTVTGQPSIEDMMMHPGNEQTDRVGDVMNRYGNAGYDVNFQDNGVEFSRPTGQYDFNPFFKLINLLAQGTTGIANKISDIGVRKKEYQDLLRAIQPTSYESYQEDGLNNNPIYTKTGGEVSSTKAKKILHDGTIRGKKLTEKQRKFFGAMSNKQDGGSGNPLVEAEEGEVFQTTDGALDKIPEGAGTHEQGGVIVSDVHRVLEDTSDKRNDKVSRALKLDPDMVEVLTGYKPKSSVSHSKAFELASEKHFDKVKKYERAIEKSVETVEKVPTNKFAENSMDLNLKNMNKIPTEGDVFDELFNHQEFVKKVLEMGAPQKAKYGGKYNVAQTGLQNYPGAKTKEGRYTPTKKDVNDLSGSVSLEDYIAKWKAAGLDLTGVKSVREAQEKTYDFLLGSEGGQKVLKAMWTEFGNTNAGRNSKILTDRFPKGDFTGADLSVDDLKALKPAYGDNLFAIRRLLPAETTETETTVTPGEQRPTALPEPQRPNLIRNPKSRFNEPLRWYDVAGPVDALLSNQRIGAKYNPVELNQLRLKLQNPLPTLQNAQTDFNAVQQMLPNNTTGQANLANVFAKKYAADNQVLGQYENINSQIKNQETMYNTNVRDRQSMGNQQAREVFEQKYLTGLEAQRQQRLSAMDDLYVRLALNRKLNREGNLLMQLFPAFDQNAEYNGYKMPIRNPLTVPDQGTAPTGVTSTVKTKKYVVLSNGKKVALD